MAKLHITPVRMGSTVREIRDGMVEETPGHMVVAHQARDKRGYGTSVILDVSSIPTLDPDKPGYSEGYPFMLVSAVGGNVIVTIGNNADASQTDGLLVLDQSQQIIPICEGDTLSAVLLEQ